MKKIFTTFTLVLSCMILLPSCKKFIETDLPKNEITSNAVFADSTNTNAAINGIYVSMMQTLNLDFSSGAITAFTGLSSDELYITANNTNTEFYSSNILPTNNTILAIWSSAFNYIYSTNACIEGIQNSTGLTNTQRNAFLGELYFIRAFLYFNLVNIYGRIPLILTTEYQKNRLLPNASIHDIYKQIVSDLEMATSYLPRTSIQNTRAGYYASMALLARVYLYTKQYEKAKEAASIIINSGVYQLEQNLDNVFLVESKEIVLGFATANTVRETWEGYYFVPATATAIPTYVITEYFYNNFETGDLRKSKWIRINFNNGKEYPIPFKYKLNALSGTVKERYSVIRLSEMFLIRSEANAYLNKITDGESDINKIRNRAGLNSISGSSQNMLLNSILTERRSELMVEWGHRWFDLKRTGFLKAIMTPLKPTWKITSQLFPIPQAEIDRNPNLSQNEGY